jgi:hypothetical protein
MTHHAHDYMQTTLTAVIGGTFNLLAFLVSMQDIEAWLRISSLVVGNLVGFLTIVKLVLAIRARKKLVDGDDL